MLNLIREEFADFILCDSGTSGHSITAKFLEALEVYGLDATYLHGD